MQLSPETKRVFLFAINEASRLGQARVEPHHLLLGMARAKGEVSQELFNIGLPLERLRSLIRSKQPLVQDGTPFYSDETRRMVSVAHEIAGDTGVETRHLLLAMIQTRDTLAYELLELLSGPRGYSLHPWLTWLSRGRPCCGQVGFTVHRE
jgi:ATP-dependent Clp protease ATP-binding subunit ClpA